MQTSLITTISLVLTVLALPAPAFSANASTSSTIVVTNDGREVELKADGSWRYLSTDRLITRQDGTQIRLKEDGSWHAIGNAPLKSEQQVRTTTLDIQLNKVVVERSEKKVQKNTRVKTQTVFHLTMKNAEQAKHPVIINSNAIDDIEVTDNNGKSYPVISISSDLNSISPGASTALTVRCKKSPSILEDIKSMQLRFNKGVFGLSNTIILSQKITEFENKDVNKL